MIAGKIAVVAGYGDVGKGSLNISFFKSAIIENLVKKVIKPQ